MLYSAFIILIIILLWRQIPIIHHSPFIFSYFLSPYLLISTPSFSFALLPLPYCSAKANTRADFEANIDWRICSIRFLFLCCRLGWLAEEMQSNKWPMSEWLVTLQDSTHNRLLYLSTPMHAIVVGIECFTWNILWWSTYFIDSCESLPHDTTPMTGCECCPPKVRV